MAVVKSSEIEKGSFYLLKELLILFLKENFQKQVGEGQ